MHTYAYDNNEFSCTILSLILRVFNIPCIARAKHSKSIAGIALSLKQNKGAKVDVEKVRT